MRDIQSYIPKLKRIEKEAKLTQDLKFAVQEIIKAINNKNYVLAEELTAVKSYVYGKMILDKNHHFGEDQNYNETELGDSAYFVLDCLHHYLAFGQGKLPSGMVVFSAEGVQERQQNNTKHPTLELMRKDHEATLNSIKKIMVR